MTDAPHAWPWIRVGHWVAVTTGKAQVESFHGDGMTVCPEQGNRIYLRLDTP